MQPLTCEIITPEKQVYFGPVKHINIDTENGFTGIYPQHSSLMSVLKKGGRIEIFGENQENNKYYFSEGFLHIKDNEIRVIISQTIEKTK